MEQEHTPIVSRDAAIKTVCTTAINDSAEFLAKFKASIQTFDISELQDTRKRMNGSTVADRLKINVYNWHLGQGLTKSAYDVLCTKFSSIAAVEVEIVESPDKLDKDGNMIIRYRNPLGLSQVTDNRLEHTMSMLRNIEVDKDLQTKYRLAVGEVDTSKAAHVEALKSGTDAAVGKAQRAAFKSVRELTSVTKEITAITPAIKDGKLFAESVKKAAIAGLKSKKAGRQTKVKIIGTLISAITERVEFLKSGEHMKIAQTAGTEYKFASSMSEVPELPEFTED
ncbi:hypothetical protein KAR91_59615 [Candidatus Pacearchaeota archaeon]|nr:hypothetical protein [Candidatus Pacearchaeota archaeon]